MDIELLIASLAFIIPMCFSPGPNNVLCAAHGSQHGFRGTLILISGMAFGWSALGLFVAVATDLIEEFYVITVERRITHPGVAAITDAARQGLFAAWNR